MKQLFAFMTAIVAAFMISATIPADSTQKDSVVIQGDSTTLFKNQAHTTVDSLQAVKEAVKDSTINALIGSAITAIATKPPAGSGVGAYVGWGIATILGALIAVFQVRKKAQSKPPKK